MTITINGIDYTLVKVDSMLSGKVKPSDDYMKLGDNIYLLEEVARFTSRDVSDACEVAYNFSKNILNLPHDQLQTTRKILTQVEGYLSTKKK